MATCPKCGTTLKDDYGMSHCPKCGAFSFIDMDGHAVIQDETPEASGPESFSLESPPAGNPSANPNYGASHEEPGGAASSSDFSDPIESLIGLPSDAGSPSDSGVNSGFGGFGSLDELGSADEVVASGDANDFMSGGNFEAIDLSPTSGDPDSFEPIDLSPQESTSGEATTPLDARAAAKPEPAFGPANDPLNLNEFANSEVSGAKDGPLLIRVLISGIDTREIRESIREVLEDSRFAWDANEIFSKVSKGHLVIPALSPVKASILITRIKRLPVQIRWEQYAITQGNR